MEDFTALNAAIARVTAQVAADASAASAVKAQLDAATATAANVQASIDAATIAVNAIAPEPTPTTAV